MTRTELIAALEAAEGPSRELDADIAEALGNPVLRPEGSSLRYVMWLPGGGTYEMEIPHYTESIDAALSFTPEGMDWRVQSHRGVKGQPVIGWALINGTASAAATPAIALCIANLRTLEAQEEA